MAQQSHPDYESITVGEIENSNLDKTVSPWTKVQGVAGKDSGGTWRYMKVSSSGALSNDDAANFRISAIGLTGLNISNDDAGDFLVSAKSGDANQLHTSAYQGDAGLMRVSAIISNTPNVGALQLTSPWVVQFSDYFPRQFGTLPFYNRSDTLSAAGNGTIVSSSGAPCRDFSVMVSGNGGVASAWDVRLEGSIDGINFSTILTHTNATGNLITLWSGTSDYPSLYFRSRVASVTLGVGPTSLDIYVMGMQ